MATSKTTARKTTRKPAAKPATKPAKATRPAKKTARPARATTPAHAKPSGTADASRLIDKRIAELGDWRGEMLARLRKLVHQADPAIVETWKWRGVPIFEHDGIVCTGETHKMVVKTTFAKGAALPDPSRIFNASLEGGTRRAIDFREGDKVDEKAFKAMVRAAVALNQAKGAQRGRK